MIGKGPKSNVSVTHFKVRMCEPLQGTGLCKALSCMEDMMISNSRLVLNVLFFLLGDSPASEFYEPTFRNTLSVK